MVYLLYLPLIILESMPIIFMRNALKQNIFYGHYSQQFAQLYNAKCANNTPVVIVIHGGYWKDNHNLDSYATSSIVDYLQTFEVAIWNIEYRRMNAEGENIKAPWPAPFKDIADGIDHLRTIKDIEGLDLNRILLIGHSAGGHLATWAASRASINSDSELYSESPLPIQRIISIAGILNLHALQDVDQPAQIQRLMGGSPQTHPERYRACDPCFLNNTYMNLTVVHGRKDACVEVSQALHFCSKAKGNVEQIIIEEADHFSMLPHDGQWQEAQWQQIKQLIAQQIKGLGVT